MNPQQANLVHINTDYPFDKVLGVFNGSFSLGARYAEFSPRRVLQSIPHNFGDWGLVVGAYSLDNSTWYPFGMRTPDLSTTPPSFQTIECTARCNSQTVDIIANNFTNTSRTVYYALQIISRD